MWSRLLSSVVLDISCLLCWRGLNLYCVVYFSSLQTHSFVSLVIHETLNICLSPFISTLLNVPYIYRTPKCPTFYQYGHCVVETPPHTGWWWCVAVFPLLGIFLKILGIWWSILELGNLPSDLGNIRHVQKIQICSIFRTLPHSVERIFSS